MDFLTLDRGDFEYGEPQWIAPLVRRVVAENPSKFTYHGTGTYLIGDGRSDVVVIDPGPAIDSHRDALAAALRGQTVRAVLVTHCHADHSPLSAWLAAESGAATFAFGPHGDDEWDIGEDPPGADDTAGQQDDEQDGQQDGDIDDAPTEPVIEESTDRDFVPDVAVRSGDVVASGPAWEMRALHTPGHTSNHTCFTLDDGTTRVLFTGDHVMGWSTTVVAPPDGDMDAYLDSLRSVAGRRDDLAIPTHGPPIEQPGPFVTALVEHRLQRERQVLDVVRGGTADIPTIVEVLYADVRRELHKPARRSVLAHLVKLVGDGVVSVDGGGRPRLDSSYRPV